MTKEKFYEVCSHIVEHVDDIFRCRMYCPSADKYYKEDCHLVGVGVDALREHFIVSSIGHTHAIHYKDVTIVKKG